MNTDLLYLGTYYKHTVLQKNGYSSYIIITRADFFATNIMDYRQMLKQKTDNELNKLTTQKIIIHKF